MNAEAKEIRNSYKQEFSKKKLKYFPYVSLNSWNAHNRMGKLLKAGTQVLTVFLHYQVL